MRSSLPFTSLISDKANTKEEGHRASLGSRVGLTLGLGGCRPVLRQVCGQGTQVHLSASYLGVFSEQTLATGNVLHFCNQNRIIKSVAFGFKRRG
jgi:hypothetical protein